MRLVSYDDHKIGVINEGFVRDVSRALVDWQPNNPHSMVHLIERWDSLRATVQELSQQGKGQAVETVTLLAPIGQPRHLFAAPINYAAHKGEVREQMLQQ
jgi:hypothetical protein